MYDIDCEVIEQTLIGADYRKLLLEAPGLADEALPGQFVHIRLPGLEESALRRPFSIYGAGEGKLHILYKTVGRGTRTMNALKKGDTVKVMGPIGRGFPLEPKGTPVLVGGGYGVAPLAFLAKRLPRKGVVLIGGRTAADVLLQDEFEAMGWDVRVATQDGSLGIAGLVTVPLDDLMAKLGGDAELYSCGPDGLLRAVGERAMVAGVKGWLSLDKHMVCGVGACLVCVQKLRRPDGTEWIGRVCKDGPVFEAREIVW